MISLKQYLPALAGTAFVFAVAGTPLSAKAETLRMANWLPPFHHMTKTLANWAAAVKKASGGTLNITILKAPLAKPPGQYDLAKNGIADLAWGVPGYTPGRFPIMRIMELPFLSPNAEIGSAALWDWYSKHKMIGREYSDTKLIMAWVHGPGVLHSKTKVTNLANLKGMKLRVGGGGVQIASKLGGVPVAMSATKAHEALLRGTVSGTFFPYEAVKGFRLSKLVKYHLEFPGGLYTTPFFMVMNKKRWTGLSSKHKAVLNKVGGQWGSRFIGRHWDDADTAGKALAIKEGNKIQTISADELTRWRARVQPMYDEWVAKANKAGLNGKALLADLKAVVSKHAK